MPCHFWRCCSCTMPSIVDVQTPPILSCRWWRPLQTCGGIAVDLAWGCCIQLEMTQVQVTEEVGVNLLGVLARSRQPQTNRHLGMPEEEWSIRDGQTEIDGKQALGDLGGRRAQTTQGRARATRKTLAARLASPLLKAFRTSLAIPDQGVEGRIGVAVIITVWVGARSPRGTNRLGPASRTFPFTPREHARLAPVAPQRRRMGPSAHGAIVRRARLEGAQGLTGGRRTRRRRGWAHGAPQMAPYHNQRPQHTEPHEIIVKHPAPGMRSTEWGARIPALGSHFHSGQVPSHGTVSAGIITYQLWEYPRVCPPFGHAAGSAGAGSGFRGGFRTG